MKNEDKKFTEDKWCEPVGNGLYVTSVGNNGTVMFHNKQMAIELEKALRLEIKKQFNIEVDIK